MIRFIATYILLTYSLLAVPIPPTKSVDIKGTVVSYVWIDKSTFHYQGDDFNLSSATRSAHYYIILKTSSLTAKEREFLSSTARVGISSGLSHPILSIKLKQDELLIQVTKPRIKRLKKGSVIELKGYSLAGDEWGVDEKFKTLTIDKVIEKK